MKSTALCLNLSGQILQLTINLEKYFYEVADIEIYEIINNPEKISHQVLIE